MFNNIYKKQKKLKEKSVNIPATENTNMDLTTYIEDIMKMLNITCPDIQFTASLYQANNPQTNELNTFAIADIINSDIPADAQFIGAFFNDETNTIYISSTYPDRSPGETTIRFNYLSTAEIIYTLSHELRHVWQKKYEKEKYYAYNAVGMDCINDIAEIDADAFALAYVFSKRTIFTALNMPNLLEEIFTQAVADRGKRLLRADELSKLYSLKSDEKIEAAKHCLDNDSINRNIALMKLNGFG